MVFELLNNIKNYVFIKHDGSSLDPTWFGRTNVYNIKNKIVFSVDGAGSVSVYVGFSKSMDINEFIFEGTPTSNILIDVYYTDNKWEDVIIEKDVDYEATLNPSDPSEPSEPSNPDEIYRYGDVYENFWSTNSFLRNLGPNTDNEVPDFKARCLKIVITPANPVNIDLSINIKGNHKINILEEDLNNFLFGNFINNLPNMFKDTDIKDMIERYTTALNYNDETE